MPSRIVCCTRCGNCSADMLAKRIFDLVASALALIMLSPLMCVLTLGVRLDSPGPAIFRHRRVGRFGRPFDVLKFRTMQNKPVVNGLQVTAANDARITRIGKVLRRTKLDELPQLINVLAGQMSLVGPRPEVPQFVAMYTEEARREIFAVRPGLTDPASIEFRNEQELLASAADPEWTYINEIMPSKIALYRQYVREQNLLLDLKILIRTVMVVFS